MDVLSVTLWLLGIIISHLLLRRVVEIDCMNKQLMSEKVVIKKDVEKLQVSDEDLQQELLEYVKAQDYETPKVEFELPPMTMTNFANNMSQPENSSNIIQEFKEERDINTGSFGDLQAYEDSGYATL